MSKTKEEMIDELSSKTPDVSIQLYDLESGKEGYGGMALHLDFGEKGPPTDEDEISTVHLVAMMLSQKFSEVMHEMQGTDMNEESTSALDKVLSSLTTATPAQSKAKDEIDKQLEEMGITPTTNKEVH